MTSRARIEWDPARNGIKVAVSQEGGNLVRVLTWENAPQVTLIDDAVVVPPENCWLHLGEDDARAIYEALGDYFGHSGADTRALRRDYDQERGRVDRLIGHLIGRA